MAPDRIEILFLIDYFHRTGGTEKHLVQLIAGLPAERFRARVVVFDMGDNPLLEQLRARGVEVLHLPVGREYVPHAWLQAVRLARLLRRARSDIVQCYHQKSDTYGALVARAAGVPVLISSKRDTGELRKPLHVFLNRRLRGLFNAFIMAADGVRAAVVARDHLPGERVVTIYNGVDTAHFRPPSATERAAARAALGCAPGDFVVGMVAGFRPEKSHEVFFAALERVALQVPALRVVAVGGGELLEPLRARLAATPLGARTLFTGAVAETRPYVWTFDVGCLTPAANEGFSNAVIEQMACGVPMIVTDVGGNAEAVRQGIDGTVIPAADPDALAAALLQAWRDPAARAAQASAASARVSERFSLERMCAEHVRLYLSLCRAAGRA